MMNHESGPQRIQNIENAASLDLKAVRSRQIARYEELGFHSALRMTKNAFKASFPEVKQQPESYKGRFDIPLFVVPNLDQRKQDELGKINEIFNVDAVVNEVLTPNKPYLIWTHNGERYRHLSVSEAKKGFTQAEIGCNLLEVTSLYLQYPEIFKDHGIDAPASRSGSGGVPYLAAWEDKPRVFVDWSDSANKKWGTGSRGKEIVTRE